MSNIKSANIVENLKKKVVRVSCPVCKSCNSIYFKTVKSWHLEKCQQCKMVFVNPCPSEESLNIAYSLPQKQYDQYFQTDNINSEKILGGTEQWQRNISMEYLGTIEKATDIKGKILEIGCGSGSFLEIAQGNGWKTAGVDIGNWRKNSKRDKKLNIEHGSLFDAGFEEKSFDVIFMGSVIEHLSNPNMYLQKIYRLLKNNGIFYVIGTPNIQSLTILMGIDKWIGNHPPLHLLYFSKKTLCKIVKDNGFSNIKVRSYGISETILETIFNRNNSSYSGEYAGIIYKKSFASYIIRITRKILYGFFDITKTGSVLELMARK